MAKPAKYGGEGNSETQSFGGSTRGVCFVTGDRQEATSQNADSGKEPGHEFAPTGGSIGKIGGKQPNHGAQVVVLDFAGGATGPKGGHQRSPGIATEGFLQCMLKLRFAASRRAQSEGKDGFHSLQDCMWHQHRAGVEIPGGLLGNPGSMAAGEMEVHGAGMVRGSRVHSGRRMIPHDPANPEIRPQDLAHLAHDLRNLLALVCGHAEIQLAQAEEDTDLYQSLLAIERAGRRGSGLCQEIMELARNETPLPSPVDLAETAQEASRIFSVRVGSGIDFHCSGSGNAIALAAPARLERALLNLLWNAQDAVLSTDRSGGRIHLRWKSEEDRVWIEVADDGPGLPGDTLGDLVDAYFSTKNNSAKDEIRGLGLHGVVETARIFGGSLFGDRDPELGGARLRLVFPNAQGESQVPCAETAAID